MWGAMTQVLRNIEIRLSVNAEHKTELVISLYRYFTLSLPKSPGAGGKFEVVVKMTADLVL